MKPTIKHLYATIEKVDKQDDGTLVVSGIASTETRDSAGELVKANAMRSAIPDYMSYGAVREMHQPIAAGTAITCTVDNDGVTRLSAHVVDPVCVLKVNTGVLKGFSIGGKIKSRDSVDKTIITGIQLTEISLVDRPANPDARIELVKIDRSGKMTLSKALRDKGGESTQLPLAKSLYDVGALAELIMRLNSIMCWAADEANWEGDNSDIPARLKESVTSLCDVLRDMVDEETQELVGIADSVITPELLMEAAAKCETIEKKGAKFSSATVGVLATVHKLLKDADAHMDGIGYAKLDNQEEETMTDAEKVELATAKARVVELEKAQEDATAKTVELTDAVAKATKAADDATAVAKLATEKLEKMAGHVGDLLEKAKKGVRVVPKSGDGNAPDSNAAEELAKAEASGKPVPFAVAMRATRMQPLGIDFRPRN